MRKKYRSAVYTFDNNQSKIVENIIKDLNPEFSNPIITKVLSFKDFKTNNISYQDYYRKHVGNQFCTRYINPKFQLLMNKFSKQVDKECNNIKEFLSVKTANNK